MKITPLRETTQTVHGVAAKRPANEESREEKRQESRDGQKDRQPPSSEELDRLIQEFSAQMTEHGFATEVVGEPREIRVLDRAGAELRRVTLGDLIEQSEHFSPRGLTRGRLFDRKV